jgi:hypothetical protein
MYGQLLVHHHHNRGAGEVVAGVVGVTGGVGVRRGVDCGAEGDFGALLYTCFLATSRCLHFLQPVTQ